VTALLGTVLSRQGAALIQGYHEATMVGAGLALAAGLCAFLTLSGKRGNDEVQLSRAGCCPGAR
jgi:hypothetical protein